MYFHPRHERSSHCIQRLQQALRIVKKSLELLTYFSLWKSADKSRAKNYDCKVCKAVGHYKNRECFLDGDPITVVIPFVKEGGRVDYEGEAEEVESPKRMLEILGELQEKIGVNQPIFSILLTSFKTICPVALIDPSHFELIKLESYARDYHVLPYPGGSLDQPNLIMEAFDVIATARSWYERDRMDEMRRRAEAARQKGVK